MAPSRVNVVSSSISASVSVSVLISIFVPVSVSVCVCLRLCLSVNLCLLNCPCMGLTRVCFSYISACVGAEVQAHPKVSEQYSRSTLLKGRSTKANGPDYTQCCQQTRS